MDARRMKARPNVTSHVANAMQVTRFWADVARVADEDACWEWTGYRDDAGYGIFTWRGRRWMAHELALTFTTGEIRSRNLETCHSCNNPPCCNPRHLRFGSRLSNVGDCVSADRHARGERNGHAILTDEQVLEIRVRRAAGAKSSDLADDYGVTVATISSIIRGDRWQHVGGPTQRLRRGRPPKGTP